VVPVPEGPPHAIGRSWGLDADRPASLSPRSHPNSATSNPISNFIGMRSVSRGREKAGVVVFPELSLTGYVLRDQSPRSRSPSKARCSSGSRRTLVGTSTSSSVTPRRLPASIPQRHGVFPEGPSPSRSPQGLPPDVRMFDEGRDFGGG